MHYTAKRNRSFWLLVLTLAMLASACATASDGIVITDPGATLPGAASTESASSAVGQATNPLKEADQANDSAPAEAAATATANPSMSAAQILRRAISFSPDNGVRMTSSAAQVFVAPGAGIRINGRVDADRPLLTATRTADQSHYIRVDLSAVADALSGRSGTLADGQIFEVWARPNEDSVVDTTSLQVLAGDPTPFDPGVWSVAADATNGVSELSQLMAGATIPDPEVVAEQLPSIMRDARITNSGLTISGAASYPDVADALGVDLALNARSGASAVAASVGVSIGDLAAEYLAVYEAADTFVEVHLPDGYGSVLTINVTVDLSHLFEHVFVEGGVVADVMSAEELAQTRAAFETVRLEIKQLITLEPIPDVSIPDVPTPTEDRTTELLRYVGLG